MITERVCVELEVGRQKVGTQHIFSKELSPQQENQVYRITERNRPLLLQQAPLLCEAIILCMIMPCIAGLPLCTYQAVADIFQRTVDLPDLLRFYPQSLSDP